MAYHVSFTLRARRDLEQLYETINAPESIAAVRWFSRLEETIAMLSTAPQMGTITHEDNAVRQIVYGNKPHLYRVLYEIDDRKQHVNVLSIWHGRRQPPTTLKS